MWRSVTVAETALSRWPLIMIMIMAMALMMILMKTMLSVMNTMMMILTMKMTKITMNFPQALECLEVPSIENGTAGQFQVLIIISYPWWRWRWRWRWSLVVCQKIVRTHIRKLFAALGSDEAGRVSLPSDRARDTTCHQGFFFIFYIFSILKVFLIMIFFLFKLHWMRQTFNNKNQKTYDEYRQGCRWVTTVFTLIESRILSFLLFDQ